ncbi:hypothetical protein [Croceiramulus getboli]|nr:hypothetical protein P8624_12110 [Flavobacteriaceae bacterium YJPT1-3]
MYRSFLWPVLLLLCSIHTLSNQAQTAQLNLSNLERPDLFELVFTGSFYDQQATALNLEFGTFFTEYVYAYARSCADYLPADKVELTYQECRERMVTRDGWGNEISSYCNDYRTVYTGLYTTPHLARAEQQLKSNPFAFMGEVMQDVQSMDAFKSSRNMKRLQLDLQHDFPIFFAQNACNSEAVLLFNDNLGRIPFRTELRRKSAPTTTKTATSLNYTQQDYLKLIDDLVTHQAKGWLMNRYQAGSVRDLQVTGASATQAPRTLVANYTFSSFGGTQNGWVRISFQNGEPRCVNFHDYPQTCNDPSPKVVSDFKKGAYTSR